VTGHQPAWDTDEPAGDPAWWAADDDTDEDEEPGDQDGGGTPRSILVAH
jgi:hypothetical protein